MADGDTNKIRQAEWRGAVKTEMAGVERALKEVKTQLTGLPCQEHAVALGRLALLTKITWGILLILLSAVIGGFVWFVRNGAG